jgi:hypothetical protein
MTRSRIRAIGPTSTNDPNQIFLGNAFEGKQDKLDGVSPKKKTTPQERPLIGAIEEDILCRNSTYRKWCSMTSSTTTRPSRKPSGKSFQNDVSLRPLRNMVAGLVGCELRHHLLFAYLAEPLSDFDDAEKRYLALALADAYFFKRIPLDQLQTVLHEKLGDAKMAKAQPFLDKAGKTDEYIPPEIPKTSNKYLSLRYNTPEWVLKIWEHYGYGTTYKILKKNNRQNTTTVRVRSSLTSVEELLNNNPDYAKTSVEGILCYGGKVPLRKLQEAHDEKIFAERPATKAVLDKFKVEEPSEAFLFDGNADSSILKEMIETYGSSIGLNLGVYDTKDYLDVSRMIKGMGLKNVNFFGADPAQMDSAISRPQDLVICRSEFLEFRPDPRISRLPPPLQKRGDG